MMDTEKRIGPAPEALAAMENTLLDNLAMVTARHRLFLVTAVVIATIAIISMLVLLEKQHLFLAIGVFVVAVFALLVSRHFVRIYTEYHAGHIQQLDHIISIRDVQQRLQNGEITATQALEMLLSPPDGERKQ